MIGAARHELVTNVAALRLAIDLQMALTRHASAFTVSAGT